MAKCALEKQVTVTLELTVEEALWIKHMAQNPIGPETASEAGVRQSLFEALPRFPELTKIWRESND
jgi:hypothetical protein